MKKIEVRFKYYKENFRENLPKIFEPAFINDSAIQLMLGFTLVILIAAWIIAFIRFQVTEFDIPLKYDSFLGVTSLGRWYALYKFPAFATFLFLVNSLLANKI